MARAKSAILSKEERNKVMADVKLQVSTQKAIHKGAVAAVKDADKEILAANKLYNAEVNSLAKAFALKTKALDKKLADAKKFVEKQTKELAKVEATLAALTPPKAVPAVPKQAELPLQ